MVKAPEILEELRETIFGKVPLADGIIPPLIFVVVNSVWGLVPAASVGVLSAIAITLWRLSQGRPLRFAIAGLGGVGLAAALALRSGNANDFFLPTIVTGVLTSAAIAVSIVARRPFVAWTSWLTRGWTLDWYWHPKVRPAYTRVSWLWLAYFAGRAVLQWRLYLAESTGSLVVTRVLLGWPALLMLLVATYVLGRRWLIRLGGPSVAEFDSGAEEPWEGQTTGF